MVAPNKTVVEFAHKEKLLLDRIAGALEYGNRLFVEAFQAEQERTYYDDQTLVKVREALRKGLLETVYHTQDDLLTSLISHMQNAGILFRERKESNG
jgi:hypothetical protein